MASSFALLLLLLQFSGAIAGPWGADFSFGDQAAPPLDTPADQFLPPPPADASTDSPYMLPPPPADPSSYSPDLPPPPPTADMYPTPETPAQPLYSSPPPAPTAFVPQTPSLPPLDTPSSSIATPPDSSATDDTSLPPPPPPVVTPHPHHVPFGASPPVPGSLAPSGANGVLPFGQGNQQHGHGQGQGVFGQQQNQLLNGAGQPLENSSGGWSRSQHGGAAMVVVLPTLAAVVSLALGFY